MGDDTTSNHDNIIATNGTAHIARANPAADICWIIKDKTQYAADNEQASKKLKTGMTKKTFIATRNVWIEGTVVDLADSLKPHPGVQGGTKSGTYLKYAHATEWSKDLKMEGGGVVRSYDKTEQNGPTGGPYNCKGFVDPSAIKGAVTAADDAQRKRCTILNIDGNCKDGRAISTKKKELILEVVGDDHIKLVAMRRDVSVPGEEGGPASCPNNHTLWIRTISIEGKVDQETKNGIDTYEFDVKDPYNPGGFSTSLKPSKVKGNDAQEIGADPEADRAGKGTSQDHQTVQQQWRQNAEIRDYNKSLPPSVSPDSPQPKQENKIAISKTDIPEQGRTNQSASTDAKGNALSAAQVNNRTAIAATNAAIQDIMAFRKFWLLHSDPPTNTIVAQACGGAQQVTLHVYPAQKITFNLFSEAINSKLQLIKDVSAIVTKFSNTFGWKFYFGFLEKPNLTIDVQYKELTKDRPDRGRWHWQVWPSAMLNFGFSPLLKVGVKGTVSILVFAGVIGKAAAWLLEKAGIEGNFFAEISISFNPSISGGFDEYRDVTIKASLLKFVIEAKAGLEAFGGSGKFTGQATIYAYATCTLEVVNPRIGTIEILEGTLTGQIQLGFKGSATATILYWNAEKSFDYSPEWLKFPPGAAKEIGTVPLIPGPWT